jgi:RNA polymerase sigma-70 factor, ECF subfamily
MPSLLQVVSDRRSWLLGRAQSLCGTRADAEDLVQETFLRFTSMFPEDSALPDTWPCAAWLISTMTHCYFDECRRRRVRERSATEPSLCQRDVQEAPDSVNLLPSSLVSTEELKRAIQRLGECARQAMVLYLDGRAHREIALELGISPGAVAKRLYDARLQLRRLLGPTLR